MGTNEIEKLVTALVITEDAGREGLGARLGVSASTIGRWETGQARPRPVLEGKLRALAAQRLATRMGTFSAQGSLPWAAEDRGEQGVRSALMDTLRAIREILHRRGRLSSRHEALDEVAKLLFAHITSIDSGGPGIGNEILSKGRERVAESLRAFVDEAVRVHMPESLSHEISRNEFRLRLGPTEHELAIDLVQCFATHAAPLAIAQAKGAGQVDVLNDVFGQFLADSFQDEKELGQYLTPTEVVRFMVRVGLESLSPEDTSALQDPSQVHQFGLLLDPSCGVGSFLAEVIRCLYDQVRESQSPDELLRWTNGLMSSCVLGIDKSERMIRLALTNLALFGAPRVNLHLANALAKSGLDGTTTQSMVGRAKLILTNPPFGAEYAGASLEGYRLASEWCRRRPAVVDSELLFLERYVDWLAPGGVLVAIVPDSVLTNRGLFEDLRKALEHRTDLLSVVSLPPVTFSAAGTSTKTSVLHLRKCASAKRTPSPTYFAVCADIGYEVSARGSQRRKVRTGQGDLLRISAEATGQVPPSIGRRTSLQADARRWDATFHAGLSAQTEQSIEASGAKNLLTVAAIASLANDRIDPRRSGTPTFPYIEISDVDASTCRVKAKHIACEAAPSRARKRVRAGDVLVSTVRPERRTIGVVPKYLDGAVCSTGFAVLRPTAIHPVVLCKLLQTDFANAQLLRNNMGIAYPAIDESCLPGVILPINSESVEALSCRGAALLELWEQLQSADDDLSERLARLAIECGTDVTIRHT